MDFGQGTISRGEQASDVGAATPMARDRTGRLPVGAPLGFATLSHSNLKSYPKIEAAQGHNTRAKDTPNARQDAPAPIELLDEKSGTYVERVKAILREHGEPGKPVKPRKNGTIACEDVYGASPEYWNRDGSWRLKPVEEIINDPVVQAALALARRKHGRRLVSCSLHLDEESPHIHVISVPLVERAHSKRGRKPKGAPRDENGKPLEDSRPKVTKWTLDVSSIRGRSSDLEKNHDEWAEVCRPFGLIRGAKGSEMTEEQRRARRNRQTGRSSHAEKDAREERERLHGEAEVKAKDAEADRLAARHEREAAEAASVRARAQEAENERVRGELAKAEANLAARKKALEEQAASLKREVDVHDDQMRLIARALDPTSPVKIYHRDGMTQAEGLDERDRNGNRGAWDWLTGGIEAFAKRLTDLVDREADAVRAREERKTLNAERHRHRQQVEILEKALNPDTELRLMPDGAGIRCVGLTEEENAALGAGPSWFKSGVKRIISGLRSIADRAASLDQRENEVEKRERGVDEQETDLTARKATLRQDEELFDEKASALQRTLDLAMRFIENWRPIPSSERSPAVDAAVKAAEAFTTEDLPPGFTLPGRGGKSR